MPASSSRPSPATSSRPTSRSTRRPVRSRPRSTDFCADPKPASASASRTPSPRRCAPGPDVDFLRFGPMAQDGRYERFAFFPDVHGTGARQIRGFLVSQDEALLKPGALARQSAAVQGLPALESLLFSGKAALLQPAPPEPFRCALAVAVAEEHASDRRRGARRMAGRQQLGGAHRETGLRQSRLPHARRGDDRDPEGDPDRPRAGARPSARSGARQDAGRGQGEPRALQRVGRRRLPISPRRPMRCSASSASPACSTCCRPASRATAARSTFEFSNLKRGARRRRPGPRQRRSPIRSSAPSSATRRSCCKACATSSSGTIAVWAGLSPGFNSLDGD